MLFRSFAAALRRIDDALGRGGSREAWLLRRGRVLEQAGDPGLARQAYEAALAAVTARPASRRQTAALREIEHEATNARERLARIPSGGNRRREEP